jgi:hypothetical protein
MSAPVHKPMLDRRTRGSSSHLTIGGSSRGPRPPAFAQSAKIGLPASALGSYDGRRGRYVSDGSADRSSERCRGRRRAPTGRGGASVLARVRSRGRLVHGERGRRRTAATGVVSSRRVVARPRGGEGGMEAPSGLSEGDAGDGEEEPCGNGRQNQGRGARAVPAPPSAPLLGAHVPLPRLSTGHRQMKPMRGYLRVRRKV